MLLKKLIKYFFPIKTQLEEGEHIKYLMMRAHIDEEKGIMYLRSVRLMDKEVTYLKVVLVDTSDSNQWRVDEDNKNKTH